jgi:hypothetical protein
MLFGLVCPNVFGAGCALVKGHERGKKDGVVTTTNGTYLCSSVTDTCHNG